MKEKELIARFPATDELGTPYEILVWQELVPVCTRDGTGYAEGMKFAETSAGELLNRIDNETFEVCESGKILRKS